MTSMPGNREPRLAAIKSSSGTSVAPPSPIFTKRPSSSFGTFTRASTSVPWSGSWSVTARLKERFEM